ncbi:MAG: ferric reductase-like transmembrane domain-containing protein [Actinomycetota bacterium]
MADQIFWYISRSAGLVSWLAAAGSILVGTLIPSRILGRRPTIPWLTDLHRMLGALASVFLLIHLAALWFDHFVQLRFDDLLIPWVADIPGLSRTSIALGVLAAWMMAAVELSSLIRDRVPPDWWRTIHLSAYASLTLGTLHAFLAGSDVTNPIVAALGTSAITAVVMASIVRIRRLQRSKRDQSGPQAGDREERPRAAPPRTPAPTPARVPIPDPMPAPHPAPIQAPVIGDHGGLLNPRPDGTTLGPSPRPPTSGGHRPPERG